LSVKGANTVESVGEMSKSQKRRRKAEKARDGSSEVVDVVVCCLSLMGTNWVGGIYEACRILKQGYVSRTCVLQ
jgi:ribosomal RNA-processing protein 8